MSITVKKVAAVAGAIVVTYVGICIALLPLLHWRDAVGRLRLMDDDVLADFSVSPPCPADAEPGSCSTKFFFGLATAPAHVEDGLNDTWLEFAKGHDGTYPVRAWQNVPIPDQRLRFWTEPEIELDLAKEVGITVFRLGIDWGRIVPEEPVDGTEQVADKSAVEHYKGILQAVRDRGMKVMLTLFHHSIPKWALLYGGWTEPRTVAYFTEFAKFAQKEFGEYVDYWITFNEPHIFVILTHCSMTWPPGGSPTLLDSLICFTPFGAYDKAMAAISEAHKATYEALHDGDSNGLVGVAHHVGVINPYGLLDIPIVLVFRRVTEFQWIDDIQYHLDFCGINYYGQEILSTAGLMLVPDEEYSEAGRGVYPDGLFNVLMSFHQRYLATRPNLRYIITENAFADDADLLRRPYLLEHLLAVNSARKQGVPIDGYVEWTISDNWEWADGYCPKFGLVDVDRADNLTRIPRPSYYLYQQVCKTGVITASQREAEWATVRAAVSKEGVRPFCRAADDYGRMWAEGRDEPAPRLIADKDWRLGKYTNPSLQIYVLRSVEVLGILLHDVLDWGLGKPHDIVAFPPELASGEL
ncbi:unnamed protein product [Calypogeia fissa]